MFAFYWLFMPIRRRSGGDKKRTKLHCLVAKLVACTTNLIVYRTTSAMKFDSVSWYERVFLLSVSLLCNTSEAVLIVNLKTLATRQCFIFAKMIFREFFFEQEIIWFILGVFQDQEVDDRKKRLTMAKPESRADVLLDALSFALLSWSFLHDR